MGNKKDLDIIAEVDFENIPRYSTKEVKRPKEEESDEDDDYEDLSDGELF